jgi:hypothetical protein
MQVRNVSDQSLEANKGGIIVVLLARRLVVWDNLVAHLLQHLVDVLRSHFVAQCNQAAEQNTI